MSILLEGECCVCEVAKVLSISQTRASRNLNILYNAGFLKYQRDGLWAYYSIDQASLTDYISTFINAIKLGFSDSETAANDRARLKDVREFRAHCCNPPCDSPDPTETSTKKKTVLFICVHNAGRSQMAEAFFNKITRGKSLAISAGPRPAEQVNPMVVAAMKEVGMDLSRIKPRLLTIEMVNSADMAITLGCENDCLQASPDAENWALDDPSGKSLHQIREIRDEIKERAARLIQQMRL
ncbi:MAG: metalloregulator ArsR/SmtB family transcription factor [Dehalococcoidia bacterium]|nr:metalloregulator ArsR/SmtB family transcription factor [Dehalococcoidia bacterium]